jgi:hypothetical protein
MLTNDKLARTITSIIKKAQDTPTDTGSGTDKTQPVAGNQGLGPNQGTGSEGSRWPFALAVGGLTGGTLLAGTTFKYWWPPVSRAAKSVWGKIKQPFKFVTQRSKPSTSTAPAAQPSISGPQTGSVSQSQPVKPEDSNKAKARPIPVPPPNPKTDTPKTHPTPVTSEPVAKIDVGKFLEPDLVIAEKYAIKKDPFELFKEISFADKWAIMGHPDRNIPGLAKIYRDQALVLFSPADLNQEKVKNIFEHKKVGNFAKLLVISKALDVISTSSKQLGLDSNGNAKEIIDKAPLYKFEVMQQNYLSLASLEAQMNKQRIKEFLAEVINSNKRKAMQFFGIKDNKVYRMRWYGNGDLKTFDLDRNEVSQIGQILQNKANSLKEGLGSLLNHFEKNIRNRTSVPDRLEHSVGNLQRHITALDELSAKISTLTEEAQKSQQVKSETGKELAGIIDRLHKINRELATSKEITEILEYSRRTSPFVDSKAFSNLQHGELFFVASGKGRFSNLDGVKFLIQDVDLGKTSKPGGIETFAIHRFVPHFPHAS